jgi:hypothetical protein
MEGWDTGYHGKWDMREEDWMDPKLWRKKTVL